MSSRTQVLDTRVSPVSAGEEEEEDEVKMKEE